jgi:hypothetical protein
MLMNAPMSSLRDLKSVIRIPTGPISSRRWTHSSTNPSCPRRHAVESQEYVGFKGLPPATRTSSPWINVGTPRPIPCLCMSLSVWVSLWVRLVSTQESLTTYASLIPSSILDTRQHLVARPLIDCDLNNSSSTTYFLLLIVMLVAFPLSSHSIVSS